MSQRLVADRQVVGSQAVVVDERGRVLLQLRLWPAGWEPPGGHVAVGEDPAQTVVRETREECGLEIEVERITGYYQFSGIRHDNDVVFLAKVVGGAPRRTREAWRLSWVSPDRLPRSLFPWYQQRIRDAVAGDPGRALDRRQHLSPLSVPRHALALLTDLISWAGRGGGPPRGS